ncbi:UNVERIFIED_CONTAM: hypothetical protein Sradi_1710000 [Sesamum radiatum]|uniref:Uncharacterized protein n=1 Tax=Sesamum radiatum TaxID=300843 RepID=A0AAW2TVW0_SESRA
MGLLSWFNPPKEDKVENPPAPQPHGSSSCAPGMNGAVEVRRPNPPVDVGVIAFGSGGKEVLSGYCPISTAIEPCTWKVLTPVVPNPPKIRIVF